MPRHALYYPHLSIDEPGFLFELLLYWDRIATIHPYEGFQPFRSGDDIGREQAALEEAYVSGITPSEKQKAAVHARLVGLLVERQPPDWYRPENLTPDDVTAVFWIDKLSQKTVRMLEESRWLQPVKGTDYATLAPAVSNVILGTLAQVCSSESLPAVTDDHGAFRASCDTLLADAGTATGIGMTRANPMPAELHDPKERAFVTTAVSALGAEPGSIGARELRILRNLRDDNSFDAQRQAFCAQVDRYIEELRLRPVEEHPVIEGEWAQRLKSERAALRNELKAARIEGIVDRDGLIGLIAAGGLGAGGALVAGVVGGPVGGAIGLGVAATRASLKLRRRRRGILEGNWASWLYTLDREFGKPRPRRTT